VYGGQESERQLHRAYRALNFLGEKLDFVTEPQLASGKAGQYAVIVAPGITHLPGGALQGLADFEGLVVTAGEACLRRDDLDRPSRAARPAREAALSDATDRELRGELAELLEANGLRRTLVVLEADTDREAWGVEWQSVRRQGAWLVNLVNYTQRPIRVELRGLRGAGVDLITGRPADVPLELAPLEPMLLRFGEPQ